MPATNIQNERIQKLNPHSIRDGNCVLYWMQQSQRAEYNHALEFAAQQANALKQPLLVAFGLMDDYPEANLRHYRFLVEGLQDAQQALERRGIKMVVQHGHPQEVAVALAKSASIVVCDRGYLRHQKQWRQHVAEKIDCAFFQVESDLIVPLEVVSNKAEYAARTIRPKISKKKDIYLAELQTTSLEKHSLNLKIGGLDLSNLDALLGKLKLDRSIEPVSRYFQGGTTQGKKVFKTFLKKRFDNYVGNRNQPQTDDVSCMSVWLHYGQMSPLWLALQVKRHKGPKACQESFLEELLVRRELAQNFVHYTDNYDNYQCLPEWARKTLAEHRDDDREHHYTRAQLESAQTHDDYWNAAMNEMKYTGFMHNYMRMYWGKKILEWSNTPEYAYKTTLYLNNKYFLDGRDANSYANVGWIFGLHDRAFAERAVYGKIRYLSAAGLERKCNINGYVEKVQRLMRAVQKNRNQNTCYSVS